MPTEDELNFIADDDDESNFVADVDKSAAARRAQAGQPAGPHVQTDEELGLATAPITSTTKPDAYTGEPGVPTVESTANLRATGSEDTQVGTVGNRIATRAAIPTGETADPLARAITAGVLAHGAGAAVAPLGRVLASAAGGATASGVQGGDPVAGAAGGVVLSGVMSFAANRVAEQLTKKAVGFMRKGNEAEQAQLLAQGKQQVADTMQRFGIGSVKNPVIARKALDDGLVRATAVRNDARDTLLAVEKNTPLHKQAQQRFDAANKDVEVLETLKPVVTRVANAHELRLTFAEKLAQAPVGTLKGVVGQAVAAPVRAAGIALKPADMALAQLFKVRALGQPITPELIAAAQAAGINPTILQRFQERK